MSRRVRGMGRGRRVRRALARGGAGLAGRLNAEVGSWPGVRVRPMFGRWGYFAGERLFGCFPLREAEHDLWIRLPPAEQQRSLREPGVRPHRRSARRGWIEMDVESGEDLGRALVWLRRARAAASRAAPDDPVAG